MIAKIKHWFKNYWYYYKWIVIIAAFFIGVIIFCTVQSTGKKKYDVQILYAGPYVFEHGETDVLANEFSQIMSADYDSDGRKTVDLVAMTSLTDDQLKEILGDEFTASDAMLYAQYTVDNVESRFSQQVFAGDSSICIVDDYWYEMLKKNNVLVDLSTVLGYKPSGSEDQYSVRIGNVPFFGFSEVSSKLPKDTRICFTVMSSAAAFTGKKSSEIFYESSKKMLADIFAFGG